MAMKIKKLLSLEGTAAWPKEEKPHIEKYQVSYQQIYQWTWKYQSNGAEGLIDKRGKRKPETEMSELEKLRAENKLLQAEKRRAQLEAAFLKKLDEIERRRF